jgi:hypothetical protein
MTSLVQRCCSSLSWPKLDSASVKVGVYKACKSAVSFLTDNQHAYQRAAVSLAYDLWNWNTLNHSSSLSLVNACLTAANLLAPVKAPVRLSPYDFYVRAGIGAVCDLIQRVQSSSGKGPAKGIPIATVTIFLVATLLEIAEKQLERNFRYWPALYGVKSGSDVDELYEQVFPAFRDRLPPNWQSMAQKNPKGDVLLHFERMTKQMRKTAPVESWAKRLEGRFAENIHELLELMIQKSPLFAKAWDLVNQPRQVTLKFVEYSDCCGVHPKGCGAFYNAFEHEICIERGGSCFSLASNLIFETINALQREEFFKLLTSAVSGTISREEYVLQKEWIENNSDIWRSRILAGNPSLEPSRNFEDLWRDANKIWEGGKKTHANNYRNVWDTCFLTSYLEKNPQFLKERMQEISQTRFLPDPVSFSSAEEEKS